MPSTASDGGLDQRVELFISTDGQLQVAGSDTLHAEVARGVAGKLEHLCAQVLADGSHVDGRGRANAAVASHAVLKVPVDTANRELATQRAHVSPRSPPACVGARDRARKTAPVLNRRTGASASSGHGHGARHERAAARASGPRGAGARAAENLQARARGARLRGALLLVGGRALASFTSLAALAALLRDTRRTAHTGSGPPTACSACRRTGRPEARGAAGAAGAETWRQARASAISHTPARRVPRATRHARRALSVCWIAAWRAARPAPRAARGGARTSPAIVFAL